MLGLGEVSKAGLCNLQGQIRSLFKMLTFSSELKNMFCNFINFLKNYIFTNF